jgi:tetratricopeptide (TPR) repeat protein
MADSLDELEPPDTLLARVAARPRRARLVEGSLVGTRFRIVRELGAGGMGVVYLARDLELDRDVAMKLHAATANATRVAREAIAMAQLAHPNVVAVYEVGVHEDRPFVVMEYVAGSTLRAWRAARERSVRDVLAVLADAGEGLAAAHAVGIVHRDFKPENVFVHASGRARVGDFGLARGIAEPIEPSAPAEDAEALTSPATATGAVLGTPAYMAPEQLAGGAADARSDQFAFCVTAWELLWGERPYAGDTFLAIQRAIGAGERRAPPPHPRVPAALRGVLDRGLARDPEARFASMRDLLEAMRAGARRRIWPYVAIAATVIGVATGTFAMTRGSSGSPCDDVGRDEPLPVVPLARKVMALGKPQWVERALVESFTSQYTQLARLACRRGPDGAWTDELAARSTACLHATMRAARQLLVAARDERTAIGVVARANALPRLEPCADPLQLARHPGAFDDAALVDARAELATAMIDLGFHRGALVAPRLARLDASPARDDPEIAAGRAMLRGLAMSRTGRTADAAKLLADAYAGARAIDNDMIATIAVTELIGIGTATPGERGDTERWLRIALADADRIATRMPTLSSQLYLAAAHFAAGQDDFDGSVKLARRALAIDPRNLSGQIEALTLIGGGLLRTGHAEEGDAAFRKAIDIEVDLDGTESTAMGYVLTEYAAVLQESGLDSERALALATRAAKLLAASDDSDDLVVNARANLGASLYQAERDDEAEPLLERARRDTIAGYGERSIGVAEIDINRAGIAIDRKDYARAIAILDNAIAILEEHLGKEHTKVADALYNLTAAARFARDYPRALAAARRMIEIYAARSPGSDRHRSALGLAAETANDAGDANAALDFATRSLALTTPTANPQLVPWAELERARALVALGRRAEAQPLLARARAAYALLNMTARVAEAERLAAM